MNHPSKFLIGGIQIAPGLHGEVGFSLRQINGIVIRFQRVVDLMRDGGGEASDGCQFAGMERGFHLLLLCHIPHDFRGADNVSSLIFYRRDGQGYINAVSVLVKARSFEVIDPLARPYLRQNQKFIVLEIRRNKERDRLPDDLFRRVAKDGLQRPCSSS